MNQNNQFDNGNVTEQNSMNNMAATQETQPKKKKSLFVSIIIGAVAIFVGQFAGEYLVNLFMGNDVDREIKKIDKYIERVEEFETGKFDDGVYESDFWSLELDFSDECWKEIDEDEVEEVMKNTKKSMMSSFDVTANNSDLDEELVSKYKESISVIPEFAMEYISDETNVAISGMAVSTYGIGAKKDGEYEKSLVEEFKRKAAVDHGAEIIDGKKYSHISILQFYETVPFSSHVLFRVEDDMFIMINYSYESGDEKAEEIIEDLFD